MRALPFSLLLALTACTSAPSWRRTGYGPEQPVPTLLAASVSHFGEFPDPFGDDPFGALRPAPGGEAGTAAVIAAAPAFAQRVEEFLAAQGFPTTTDAARAKHLTEDFMLGGRFDWTRADTAPRPFGEIPLFGPGSKESLVSRLQGTEQREAYASVWIHFTSPDHDLTQGVHCHLWIQIVDRRARLVFEGFGHGDGAASKPPAAALDTAFTAALATLGQPVIVRDD